jgi:uncharacterized protein
LKTALLDVNVLIALLWPAHEHYDAAHGWFGARGPRAKWATCPLTQMAFVRIISNPAFSPDALAPTDALGVLERNLAHPGHEFWPNALGMVEAVGPVVSRIQGYRQIADAYLLGLALGRRGTLATFDRGIRVLASGERTAALEVVPTTPGPRSRA